MKRFVAALTAALLVIALSGCSVLTAAIRKVRPLLRHSATPSVVTETVEPQGTEDRTAEPEATIEPNDETEAPTAEPTEEPATQPLVCTSKRLGISFTLPDSWAGKYRIEQGDGYLTVYFAPAEPIDKDKGDGMLFTILKTTSEDYEGMLDNEQKVAINGITYLCGTSTDVSYSEDQPEYDTYQKMMQDLPEIYKTLRAAD